MIRTLLTTTALTALLVTGTYAQSTPAPSPNPPAQAQPAAPAADTSPVPTYTAAPDDKMATKIIGMGVYDSTDQKAQKIGDINDMVVNKDGSIAAVVIGVGGFLGVGEKNVAVDYSKVQWTKAQDGTIRLVLPTSKDALNSAPGFNAPNTDNNANNTAANTAPATAPAPDNMAANTNATAPAAGGGMAMAPGATMAPNSNQMAANTPPAANNPPPAKTAEVDMSKLTPLQANSLQTADLKGIDVVNSAGDIIGQIGDFVLDKSGKVDAVIVDFGGFLGIGQKQVALGLDNLQFMADQSNKRYLKADVTKDELQNQATYDAKTYPQNRDQQRLVVKTS